MAETHNDPLIIPKKGAEAEVIRKFLDRICDRESTKRRELEMEMLENKAYIEGFQWLLRNKVDPKRAPRFVTAEPKEKGIPMPVTNEILGPVDNEVARLAKRNSEAYVDPSDQTPESKAGAKVANDCFDSHLREIKWPRIRRKGIYQDVLYGTMILESFLELDNLDTVKIGVTGPKGEPVAHRCTGKTIPPNQDEVGAAIALGMPIPPSTQVPPCGCTLAKTEFPAEKMGQVSPEGIGNIQIEPTFDFQNRQAGTKYSAAGCLSCGGGIEPFIPDLTEAHKADYFGRPLGQDVPKGCAKIEVLSPLEWFPFNEGIGQEPATLEGYAFANAKSVDWIKRYYQKNTDKVKPEDSALVAECSPILGEYDHQALGTNSAITRPIFHNHVRHRGCVVMPTMDFPRGRFFVMAGNIVVADDDLLIDPEPIDGELPGKPFPRRALGIARCFVKDGEIWGQGAPVHAKSLQNRINMTNSQIVDTREHAVGGILASRGMKLLKEWAKGFAGYLFRYDADPAVPEARPVPFRTGQPDGNALKEIEYATDRIKSILGEMAVETGGVPAPGVVAASALQLSAEKAAERRQQREKELIDAFEEVFEHQLKLIQRYYRKEDGRTYSVEATKGWEKREFYGAQINGETGIKIREMPAYDVKIAERESFWQMAERGIIPLTTAYQRREAGKIMGAPMSILEKDNLQLDAAGRKGFRFLREGIVPVIDKNIDDHTIHFQEYGRLLLSEEWVELAEKVRWDQLTKALWGWEEDLAKAQLAVMEAKSAGWLPGMPIQPYQQMAYQGKLAGYQQGAAQLKQAMDQGAAMPPGGVPPPPQPPAVFPNPNPPPEPLPDLILWVWQGRFIERRIQATPDQLNFAGFHAVYEAHHILSEAEIQAQMAGQVQAPAPGSSAPPGSRWNSL